MARPLVDFVDAQRLPSADRMFAGASAPAGVRTLSVDGETGAESLVVEFPPGWAIPSSTWDADLEIMVLDGAVHAGQTVAGRLDYVFVPAGSPLPPLHAPGGARLLAFTSGPATPRAAGGDRERCARVLRLSEMEWEQPRTPGFPTGSGRKTLRLDEKSGQGFWVLGLLPHWSSPMREWHGFAEENYVLDGELETTVGVMTTDCYLSHPAGPDCVHGPMRSRRGALLVTRSVGPFSTVYEPAPAGTALTGPWP